MTTWKFEKQFVNKLSLLRIILQRKEKKNGVLCLLSSPPSSLSETSSFKMLEKSRHIPDGQD